MDLPSMCQTSQLGAGGEDGSHCDGIWLNSNAKHLAEELQSLRVVCGVLESGDYRVPGEDISLEHRLKYFRRLLHSMTFSVEVNKRICDRHIKTVSNLHNKSMNVSPTIQVSRRSEHGEDSRHCKPAWNHTFLQHPVKIVFRVRKSPHLREPIDHGIPKHHIFFRNFIKHHLCVVHDS
ncbi:hypothetical protein IEQ34_012608 [Dendrobium chrysotoxum]|uniref:Uncharacterized protein n=1 Tax=Dendrobium chrysotoxum TaxID=161865 RepID=A0AAV7GP34_DENCH|nr:hypothetical protein IEQ34_012608 [Dendrobium chrysotoxum]